MFGVSQSYILKSLLPPNHKNTIIITLLLLSVFISTLLEQDVPYICLSCDRPDRYFCRCPHLVEAFLLERIPETWGEKIFRKMMKDGLDQLEITELRLGQPGADNTLLVKKQNKRDFSDMSGSDDKKTEVVGWPPVCSYRRKNGVADGKNAAEASKMYVKVSMDGIPFLRKIDLNAHSGYKDLIKGFHKLFSCEKMSINEEGNGSEYVPIYEDKDGDWMLVGDVPWQMFTESCKRLRIMKKSEAKGFEPCGRKTASTTGSSDEGL